MLSLYVHGVSWNLTRKEPAGRRGPRVGNGFKLQSPRTRHSARHCWVTGVGRPLARIRGPDATRARCCTAHAELSRVGREGQE
jgi:hypothetical protein